VVLKQFDEQFFWLKGSSLGLANVRNCQHNSYGIPAIKNAAKGIVGG
jgi:hypothetical protein